MLKRITLLLLSVILGISAFAFDFVGKTYKGKNPDNSVMTISFRSNGRAPSTITSNGRKIYSATMGWEISGDFINLYDPKSGEVFYLAITQDCDESENCEVVLVIPSQYGGYGTKFYQVKSSGSSSSKSSKRKR